MGRFPHRSFLGRGDKDDAQHVAWALEQTNMTSMSHRLLHTLSGGERQRAWIAMALAQRPQVLLLDEPTTYLDVHHQLELMELVVRLHNEMGLMVIMVLHDLNHAARYSERLIALKKGTIMADGPTDEVFTQSVIEELYDVKAVIMRVEANGTQYPVCFPYSVEEHD